MQYWHPILCRVEEDINVFLASFVSYLHTVIPSFPLCMLTTCHLSLTFSQQPLETLLISWFQSIPAWVPMYTWGFVCTRGSLSWIEWSLAAVCSLPISEIAVWFNTVNDLSNVNLLSYYYYRGRITFFRDMISTPWVVSVWLVEQGLSVGNANSKRTHQLSCSSFQAWGQFIPSMEGGRGRDGVQGSYRLWLQVRHFLCCHQFKDVLIIITFASRFLSTSCLWLLLKQRLASLYLSQ